MQSHSLHDANQTAEMADAYVSQPTTRAACHYQLSNFDSQQFLHWHHSIQTEYNYLNPFDAVMSAWKLGWSVFCDAFDGSTMRPPTAEAVHDRKGRPDHAFAVLEDASPLRSCIRKIRDIQAVHPKKVQFHDLTSIHIGLEDELSMQCTDMNTFELATWSEKPWIKKPSKSCLAGDIARPERNRFQQSRRPRISEVRLTDEHANVPRRIAAASTTPPNAPPNQIHLPPPPAFVTDIFGLPGFLALPHDFLMENTFLVRTWYVHHYHFPRWAVPRFVELDHRWVLWQREIASSWRDMIQPNEDVQFFTVLPDPDRSFLQRQAVADVLVVQGTDAERYAGLLTVHHQNAQGSLHPFAVAVSLPDEVSGLGLAAAADITHLCNTHRCNLFFGWQLIPYSIVPAHYMLDGHGFAAHITPQINQRAADSTPSESSNAGQLAQQNGDGHQQTVGTDRRSRDQGGDDHDFDDEAERLTDTSLPESTTQFEQWQGVQVYRLGRPVVHCFIRWGTYNAILHEIVRFLGEHFRNLIGIHHVQCALVGQHEAEESVVLQHVNDLPPGSTEKLIILDIEVHFPGLQVGLLRAPEVTRRVHRVVPQLTRAYVLRLARLFNYCFLQGDRCLVYWDLSLWPEQDTRVRTIQHGTYLRVVATPPLDSTVSIEAALNFAISVDEDEAAVTFDCTSQPRSGRALALTQNHASFRNIPEDTIGLHSISQRALTSQMSDTCLPNWKRHLASAFNEHSFVECDEEGFVAYITTWFVDHLRSPRCENSRPVRLIGAELDAWLEQILEVWQDVVDQSSSVDIKFVTPTPPHIATETTLAHLLLEQNRPTATHSAGIISVVRQGRRHAALRHVAVSLGRQVTAAAVLRKVSLQDLCAIQRCRVAFRRLILNPGDVEDFDSGFCLVVQVTTRAKYEQSDDEDSFHSHQPLWAPAMAAAMDAHHLPAEGGSDTQEDNVSFIQVAQRAHDQNSLDANVTTCRPGEVGEDLGFPIIRPVPDLPRRRRLPRHDGREDWIPPLGHLFHTQGTRGVWDNELTMHVTTWYIHHNLRMTCRRPRIVQLHGNPITWIEDLRAAWVDFMERGSSFSIHIVQPRPHQHLVQPSVCHILLVQGIREQYVAAVFTALMEGTPHDAIVQGAYSAPAQVDRAIVAQLMELEQFTIHRRCRLFRDRQMLDEEVAVAIVPGSSLSIRIEAPHEPAQTNDPIDLLHFEDLSLMQASHGQPQPAACPFNPNTPTFNPDGPNLWLFPDFVRDLHSEFETAAFTWEGETASIKVMIWFVDHRFHFPTCLYPRTATLFEDFTDWEQRIKSTWQDSIHPGLAIEIEVVKPTPPQLETGIAAHVIMVQAPNDAWSTTLVSTIDLNLGHQPVRRAITTPDRTTFEHVVRAVGYEDICLPSHGRPPCALWYDLQRIRIGHPFLSWTGFSFVLVIDDLAQLAHRQAADANDADMTFLLQKPPSSAPKHDEPVNQPDCLQICFEEASHALDKLDSHFTLPVFDLEVCLQGHAHWLPQCLPWIRAGWYACDQPIDHVSVYYDGSYLKQEGTAGAAAAAFVLQGDRWLFAGAVSAHLPSPEFGSYTAEVRAALLATKQAYDLVKIAAEVFGCQPSVTFFFDALSVGKQAEGLWQAKKDKVSCHAVRSLLRIMQTRWQICCNHVFVPGHSGDPGNELVDTIALCAAHGFPLQDWSTIFCMLTNWHFVQALSWGWVFQHPSFGKYWSDSTLHLPAKPQTTPEPSTVGSTASYGSGQIADTVTIKLNLLTCNVLTLTQGSGKANEDHPNPLGPARLQTITKQFLQANISIFALQETRLRTSVRLHSPDYFLWHAPANCKGQFGILLGFAKQQPFAFQHDGKPHGQGWFDDNDFAVVAADPRFMIIKVHARCLKCIIVAAHAPHSGADLDTIEMFWQQVSQAVPKKYDGWPRLLLADANCRFGDCPNQHINDHDSEISTAKSDAFCQFVATQNLFIHASFSTCHTGPSGTWCHPNGDWTRNDVIGVDLAWPLLTCRSWIDTHIDVSLQKDDHRPACVSIMWHSENVQARPRKGMPKCPPKFCAEALTALKTQQASHDWFYTDVHTHFHILQHELAACTR